jgi:hypothetical protein
LISEGAKYIHFWIVETSAFSLLEWGFVVDAYLFLCQILWKAFFDSRAPMIFSFFLKKSIFLSINKL